MSKPNDQTIAKTVNETKASRKAGEISNKSQGYMKTFLNGLIKENPVFVLVLGTCPTLAITTMASNAIGMGIAATLVLIGSNVVISLLKQLIPQKVRIPAYITIVAGFVTIVQMFIKAYFPSIDNALGIFLPLIVVNCIILARAEVFASKNSVGASALDGLGMGLGFTAAIFIIASIREIIGSGSWMGISLLPSFLSPVMIISLPAGGFFVFGVMMALVNGIMKRFGRSLPQTGCAACPAKGHCAGENDQPEPEPKPGGPDPNKV